MNCAATAPLRLKRSKRPGGDHRGNSYSRRARKLWMLAQARWNGNGAECDCVLGWVAECSGRVNYATVEADRINPGGSYARDNVQPACRACNLARSDQPMTALAAVAA